ncbi:MAG: hypothetical protein R3C31_07545 [Hyphomonadaceae bacterium]
MSAGDKKSKSKKSAARQRAAQGISLTDALAEAAWAEADAALAQALADFDETQTAEGARARKDALERLGQALSRAARKRGLARLGSLEDELTYDPDAHDLNEAVAKTPKTVRIQARGVTRGGEVLTKPRVGRVSRKKRS